MKLFCALLIAAAASAPAAALKQAEFTRVINDVKILPEAATPAPAKVGDTITGRTAVSTGVQSRAELRYPDRTLTRLGANSVFRMDQGSRAVDVEKGVILLQVPKQLGGAQVRTAAVTAAITGTTLLVEHTTDGYIKIIVIEGEVDVFLNANRRQFRTLTAGDLWITQSNDTSSLPMPVKIDLKRLRRTSKLLSEEEFGPLGNLSQIEEALDEQARLKQEGELMATTFRIEGRGRQVTLMQGERQHVLGLRTPPVRPPAPSPPPTVARRPSRAPSPVVIEPNKPVNVAQTTVFDNRSVIRTVPSATAYNSAAGAFGPLPGSSYVPADDRPFNMYMYDDPLVFADIDSFMEGQDSWFVFKGDEIFISGDVTVDTTGGPGSLLLGATRDFRFTGEAPFPGAGLAPGNTWSLESALDALAFTSLDGSVIFDDFVLTGGSQNILFRADGPESDVSLTGGLSDARIEVPEGTFEARAGRDVLMIDVSAVASTVALQAGRDVQLSGGAAVQGRTITVDAGRDASLGTATGGGATLRASESITVQAQQSLKITSSSQLRKLTEADPLAVSLAAANGSLDLEGGSLIDADTVSLAATRGDLRLTGSTIAAREIKARVFDTGGTLHLSNAILGRGTNPSDLIRLYGEGAGGVRFTGDTTLRGTGVDIAGTSVTIDSGSRVRLANPAGTRVFADSHNYNNRVNGNFTGLADGQAGARPVEVNKQPYASRPGF